MNAWVTGLITLACVLAGAMLGLRLQRVLPEHHLSAGSQDVVKLVAGLLATLSALVLGLLIASAKGTFDAVRDGLRQSAAKVIVVDRLLADYGPEAKAARDDLKRGYAERIAKLFPGERGGDLQADRRLSASALVDIQRSLQTLAPATDAQRDLVNRARRIADEAADARWLTFEESTTSTPPVFIAVVVSWLVMMFASFGLFSPRNGTTLAALFCGALAVATSIVLIEEMNQPLSGVIAISSEPLRSALSVLGQ